MGGTLLRSIGVMRARSTHRAAESGVQHAPAHPLGKRGFGQSLAAPTQVAKPQGRNVPPTARETAHGAHSAVHSRTGGTPPPSNPVFSRPCSVKSISLDQLTISLMPPMRSHRRG